jgi:hypothetical protein
MDLAELEIQYPPRHQLPARAHGMRNEMKGARGSAEKESADGADSCPEFGGGARECQQTRRGNSAVVLTRRRPGSPWPRIAGFLVRTRYGARQALLVGLEEIEDSLPHTTHLDAGHEKRSPRIASPALGPTQAPVGASRPGRTSWWRQADGQGG